MALGGIRALTDQSIATADVDDYTQQTLAKVNALLTLQETGGTLTTDGTEQNLYIVNNPYAGSMKPLVVFVDLTNMTAAETVTFKTYYRIAGLAGDFEQQDDSIYIGAGGGLPAGRTIIAIDLLPCRFGVQLTIQRTAGTDKAYTYSVMEES